MITFFMFIAFFCLNLFSTTNIYVSILMCSIVIPSCMNAQYHDADQGFFAWLVDLSAAENVWKFTAGHRHWKESRRGSEEGSNTSLVFLLPPPTHLLSIETRACSKILWKKTWSNSPRDNNERALGIPPTSSKMWAARKISHESAGIIVNRLEIKSYGLGVRARPSPVSYL